VEKKGIPHPLSAAGEDDHLTGESSDKFQTPLTKKLNDNL
jgi:hypothetical protein